jgi:hypothetical protein
VPSNRCTPFLGDLEEVLDDAEPLFGVEPSGEAHRTLHIGEKNSDVFALALQPAPCLPDLVHEVRGCGRRAPRLASGGAAADGGRSDRRPRLLGKRGAAFAAEFLIELIRGAAGWTRVAQSRAASGAKFSSVTIVVSASGAAHSISLEPCAAGSFPGQLKWRFGVPRFAIGRLCCRTSASPASIGRPWKNEGGRLPLATVRISGSAWGPGPTISGEPSKIWTSPSANQPYV